MAKQKTIDPIYKKFNGQVLRSVGSTELYPYFMDIMGQGKSAYQFSNRRIEKTVDERWVEAIEAVIKPMQEIINNPRNFIMSEEIIVNVALAKKVEPDAVRHLAQHGNMIDKYENDSVRPNKLMMKSKEDTWNTYENKFVYTLLEMTWEFVDKRYDAIFAAMGDEFGAFLKMSSDFRGLSEHVTVNVDIRIKQEEDLLSADEKNESIFSRIARIHRILATFRSSAFAKTMVKYGKIKPPLIKTNAIGKNPNFKACHKLWNFILAYKDVGYKIDIFEQSNEITDDFEKDIKHSVLFDYIILKNYLEFSDDRVIDTRRNFRKKQMKPKYIKEIVEEIVNNYDLPDVEIRKVLIEEITKAQLLKEQKEEQMRLVEQKEKEAREKKKQEEAEKKKKALEEEKERKKKQKEEEKEQARLEKEKAAEEARIKKEQEKFIADEARMVDSFRKELEKLRKDLELSAQKDAEREAKEQLEAKKKQETAKKKAAVSKSGAKKPGAKKPAAKKSASKKPAAEKSDAVKENKPEAKEKPAEVKPAEEKPAEMKPAEEKPAEVKPAEDKPAEMKPAEKAKTVAAVIAKNEITEKPAAVKAEPEPETKEAGPVTEVKPKQPAEEAKPKQPEEEEKPKQPEEEEKPKQPAEEAKPKQPEEEAKPEQPAETKEPEIQEEPEEVTEEPEKKKTEKAAGKGLRNLLRGILKR